MDKSISKKSSELKNSVITIKLSLPQAEILKRSFIRKLVRKTINCHCLADPCGWAITTDDKPILDIYTDIGYESYNSKDLDQQMIEAVLKLQRLFIGKKLNEQAIDMDDETTQYVIICMDEYITDVENWCLKIDSHCEFPTEIVEFEETYLYQVAQVMQFGLDEWEMKDNALERT